MGIKVKEFPCMWVVVKIMVPVWVPKIIRHLLFRVPFKKGPLILTTTHAKPQILLACATKGGAASCVRAAQSRAQIPKRSLAEVSEALLRFKHALGMQF